MSDRILFIGTFEDREYVHRLKGCMADAAVSVLFPTEITTLREIEYKCQANNITKVISTHPQLLSKLLPIKNKPAISNYAGSTLKKNGIDYLFIHPLPQLVTVSHGAFLTRRYCSKFTQPYKWIKYPSFKHTVLSSENIEDAFLNLSSASAIAVDIETKKEPFVHMTCIAYTGIFYVEGKIELRSYVIPCTNDYYLTWIRKFNWELKASKILQNGKYDVAYLLRYNCPLYDYRWDTASMMHCWYSELPKTLEVVAAFFSCDAFYWKDLSETDDLYEYYKYNALDTYYTAIAFIGWMLEAPQWAKHNYEQEFPVTFPCILAEMTGIQRDMEILEKARIEVDAKIAKDQARLEAITIKGLNPNSPKQIKELLRVIGCGDLESTEEKVLKKAALRHPLNSLIINLILEIRGNRKLSSTYLVEGKEFNGTILYSLTPWGTDTGRLASKEHHFWCGLQIQNIPRGREVKQTLRAYDGFRVGECDLEQAESRDTAYISGDTNLIKAVESDKDFHSLNASAFFGIAYDLIYSDELHKTIDKVLRDLSKRVNHGANYNMGAYVLIDTMGEDKIWEAQRILKLPMYWSSQKVAEHLLETFHKTYPMIKKSYYAWVIHTVETTRMLTGATGWTRYCFGNPAKNKMDLNAYVAHNPQSLNAMKLNKAFMRVFYEVALPNPKDFRLCAQIHDSILFQFREGRTELAEQVRERMQITLDIKATTGVNYTYTVPAALKLGKDGQGSKYWSDTE